MTVKGIRLKKGSYLYGVVSGFGQQLQFDTGSSSGISSEIMALQALQNMYQSAGSVVSNNIRKNKARIKYNTIVYLVNTQQE